jgi:hypothetical protein
MDTIYTIILGIIVLLLIYFVYTYYFSNTSTLSSSLWLNQTNPPITTITNPQSSVFTFGVWIYINTWSQGPTNLFNCSNANQTHFSLDLPVSSPTLTCSINTGITACNPSATPVVITITNNIGIQRWVYVLVSVNTNIVDCYLDGKLVTSTQLNGIPTISCNNANNNNNWSVILGTGDIYISNFQRWATATDPATAASYYKVKPAASKVFSSYGANVQVTKDNVPQQSIKLF